MYTLIQLTDPHFGAANPEQAQRVVELANQLNPNFTLISGDFSMRARKAEMQAAKDWLAQLPKPQLTIPGNHDVPLLNQLFDRFFRPFRRYKEYINEDLEPTAELPIGKILSFNTSTPFGLHIDWSRGFLSPFQGNGIETDFENTEGLRIVTFHHPLHRADDQSRTLISPLPLIKKSLAIGKVDLLFAGHFHQSFSGVIDLDHDDRNVVVSQASTACSTRTKGEPAGFHFLRLDTNRIEILRYRWSEQAKDFLHDLTSVFIKSNDLWKQIKG